MKTILIVDDTKTDRELMAKVVGGAGYAVHFGTDGDEALARALEVKPDLILLDIVMERVDGFKACRMLKQDPATKHIPVVFVSTKEGESDKFWGKRQGADDHVGKPFTPESLLAAISRNMK
jgi:twitching motility two-component system response regulator PilH